MIGKIHDKNSMFLRISAGEAKRGRKKYELTISPGGTPIVRSLWSGKSFTLSWTDIIGLAIEAGIDKK